MNGTGGRKETYIGNIQDVFFAIIYVNKISIN